MADEHEVTVWLLSTLQLRCSINRYLRGLFWLSLVVWWAAFVEDKDGMEKTLGVERERRKKSVILSRIMFYYEAPQTVPAKHLQKPSLFLAGGISGCPDWQMEMRNLLINSELLLLNPRRADFPMDDPDAARGQIGWEHRQLNNANAVAFWFPAETLCPIVLFELGAWAYASRIDSVSHGEGGTQNPNLVKKPIFVGVHPEYQRRQDVEIQLSLIRPDVEIVCDLAVLAAQIVKWEESLQAK